MTDTPALPDLKVHGLATPFLYQARMDEQTQGESNLDVLVFDFLGTGLIRAWLNGQGIDHEGGVRYRVDDSDPEHLRVVLSDSQDQTLADLCVGRFVRRYFLAKYSGS